MDNRRGQVLSMIYLEAEVSSVFLNTRLARSHLPNMPSERRRRHCRLVAPVPPGALPESKSSHACVCKAYTLGEFSPLVSG
jgi:hypothetical protein